MSQARRRRLERLEARQPRGRHYVDPFLALMSLWEAFTADRVAAKAGRPFSRRPRPEPAEPWSEEAKAAYDRMVAEHDSIARRLATAVDHAV
jgi:hypothetical protein